MLEVGVIWNSSYAILSKVFFYLEDVDIRACFRSSSKSSTITPSSSRGSTSGSSSSNNEKEVLPTTKKPFPSRSSTSPHRKNRQSNIPKEMWEGNIKELGK